MGNQILGSSSFNSLVLSTCALLLVLPCTTKAQDLNLKMSGFVTLNYSQSDSDVNFQRFIDKSGTFKSGSIAGIQGDLTLNRKLSATLQVVAAPRLDSDSGVEPSVRWGFLSYSAAPGLKLRVGRQRVPLNQDSKNLDVGATYIPARLSPEVYYNPGFLQVDGFSATQAFFHKDGSQTELALYAGKTNFSNRVFNSTTRQVLFRDLDVSGRLLSLTHSFDDDRSIYASYLDLEVKQQLENGLRVNSEGYVANLGFRVSYAGLDFNGQMSRSITKSSSLVNGRKFENPRFEANAGNLVVSKTFGKLTPYATVSRYVSQAPDQKSVGVGLNYSYSLDTVLKAEVLRVQAKKGGGFFFDAGPMDSPEANIVTLGVSRVF